jgi:hypothetical protein
LLPTLAFYSKDVEGGAERSKLLEAILYMINKEFQGNLIAFVLHNSIPGYKNGSTYTPEMLNQNELRHIEEQITNALVALKLSLRIFKLKKNDDHE